MVIIVRKLDSGRIMQLKTSPKPYSNTVMNNSADNISYASPTLRENLSLLSEVVEHMMRYAVVLTHGKLLVLRLAISNAVGTLRDSASAGLTETWDTYRDHKPTLYSLSHVLHCIAHPGRRSSRGSIQFPSVSLLGGCHSVGTLQNFSTV